MHEELADRIRKNPQFRKTKREIWRRWRSLRGDKQFILETARLKLYLSLGLENHPDDIKAFFKPMFVPTLLKTRNIARRIKNVSDPELRVALNRYISYVFRFGVAMELCKREPRFRTKLVAVTNTKFHVKVIDNQFMPVAPFFWDGQSPVQDFFPAEINVGPKLQKFIDDGHGRYVQIEDDGKNSLLKQLIDFAYSPSELTLVLLDAAQPFILCLIGESISVDDAWKKASGVIGEFQKKYYGRINAGRPLTEAFRKKLAILLRVPGSPLTSKAIALIQRQNRYLTDDRLKSAMNSAMSSLSQLKGKLKLQ